MNPLLTTKQVAEFLNCKPSTVYAWAKSGDIPCYKVNGLLRFGSGEIEAWISNFKGGRNAVKVRIRPRGDSDIEKIVERAIASSVKLEYNHIQRGSQTKTARKGGSSGTV